jgi:hypothetical protein
VRAKNKLRLLPLSSLPLDSEDIRWTGGRYPDAMMYADKLRSMSSNDVTLSVSQQEFTRGTTTVTPLMISTAAAPPRK